MFKRKKKKKKSWGIFLKRLFLAFLFFIFLGSSIWVLFCSSYTELQNLEIITEKLEKRIVEDISNEYRAEFWFRYGSKNNFFLFPRKIFAETLKERFKIIREVIFENKFPNVIVVKIEEREGLIIWCSSEKCFLMDETGLLFYQLQAGEREKRFKNYPVLIDKSNLEVKNNQVIEDGQLVSSLFEIKKLLKEKIGLDVERRIETSSLISKEIRFETLNGWQVYFNIENDIDSQVELLKEILKSSLSNKEKEKLNYIDLRIEGKAIYNTDVEIEVDNNNDEN